MYVQPDTEIIILYGVPIDSSYTHSLYFETSTEQETTFQSYAKRIPNEMGVLQPLMLTGHQYQRINSNVLKVAIKADLIYECNYLMFKNSSHSDKWYYAFINSVEYINEQTAQINYTLDVIQTYMFDYHFGQCFIERQHSTTDNIGDNIVPENLETGDMYVVNRKEIQNASLITGNNNTTPYTTGILIYSTYPLVYYDDGTRIEFDGTDNKKVVICSNINGVYEGCGVYYMDMSKAEGQGAQLLNQLSHIGKAESIIAIQMCSLKWVTLDIPHNNTAVFYEVTSINQNMTDNYVMAINSTTGYIPIYSTKPKNNKIYTYPYTYCQLKDNSNNYNILKFEYFNGLNEPNKTIQFKTETSVNNPNQQLLVYPLNYNNVPANITEGITSDMTTLSIYSYNLFNNWYAQNQNAIQTANGIDATKMTLGFLTIAASALSGYLSGGITPMLARMGSVGVYTALNGVNSLLSTEAKIADKQKLPMETKGVTGTNLINLANAHGRIYAETLRLRTAYMKRIDDYFTMFGYAQANMSIPNIHARESFTYIKTGNCNIHAKQDATGKAITSFTCDVEDKICEIFNNGITFWVNPSDVGDYNVNNGVLTGV